MNNPDTLDDKVIDRNPLNKLEKYVANEFYKALWRGSLKEISPSSWPDTADEYARGVMDQLTKCINTTLLEMIGEDEKTQWCTNPRSPNLCMVCYGDDYCVHEIRDILRAELRQQIQQQTKETE